MQATPLFLGACALASIAGVVSGATIDTRPIQHPGVGSELVARSNFHVGPADNGLSDQVALPDHYALNTPDGKVEVGELSTRGLYAQRRFGWREAQWTPPPEPAFSEPQADPEWSASSAELGANEPAGADDPGVSQVAAPGPAGQARIIDVESVLASQSG